MPAFWINEYEVPDELLELLNEQELPEELRRLIVKAKNEVESQGAVTYPTKTNIENNMREYERYWIMLHKNDTE